MNVVSFALLFRALVSFQRHLSLISLVKVDSGLSDSRLAFQTRDFSAFTVVFNAQRAQMTLDPVVDSCTSRCLMKTTPKFAHFLSGSISNLEKVCRGGDNGPISEQVVDLLVPRIFKELDT